MGAHMCDPKELFTLQFPISIPLQLEPSCLSFILLPHVLPHAFAEDKAAADPDADATPRGLLVSFLIPVSLPKPHDPLAPPPSTALPCE